MDLIRQVFYPVIFTICSCIGLTSCESKAPVQTITMGASISLSESLIWITDELGYFEEQGIKLDFQLYPSGKRALKAMLQNKVELATTAVTPFAITGFERDDIRLYATIGQSDNIIRILARRDRGITLPGDLRGKTIGTQKGSAVHFFLSSFLLYHQISLDSINIRFMKAEDLPVALLNGEIDAFSMREPFISQANELIGADNLIEFSQQGLYTKMYNLVSRSDFIDKYPGALQKILFALNKAANYADQNPKKAIAIISKKFKLPKKKVSALWPDMRIALSLNQGILNTLQEEAQWALESKILQQSKNNNNSIPDFLTLIDPVPLEETMPYAVGLIGIKSR